MWCQYFYTTYFWPPLTLNSTYLLSVNVPRSFQKLRQNSTLFVFHFLIEKALQIIPSEIIYFEENKDAVSFKPPNLRSIHSRSSRWNKRFIRIWKIIDQNHTLAFWMHLLSPASSQGSEKEGRHNFGQISEMESNKVDQ